MEVLEVTSRIGSARTIVKTFAVFRKTDHDLVGARAAKVVQKKWARFGGGFYGATAIWTLIVLELSDLYALVADWPGMVL